MKTFHPDVETLDLDDGFCCECFDDEMVLTLVIHLSCALSEVVLMRVSCLKDLASDGKVA